MSFRFLNPFYAERKRFPNALFYSAAFHLAIFYLLFGDPLSIFDQRRREPLETRELRVQLFSPLQAEKRLRREGDREDFPVFPREENADASQAQESAASEEGIGRVDAPPPALPASQPHRPPPKNMTGPQDCLLKVVAMVCPDADLQCLADYKAFCSTLPE